MTSSQPPVQTNVQPPQPPTQAQSPSSPSLIQSSTQPTQILTFQEYLFYQGEPDVVYELFRGRLIPMSTPSALHSSICTFLVYQLQAYIAAQNLDLVAITVVGVRTETDSSRIPNVMVCSQSLWQQVQARSGAGVLDFQEVPALVIEVTSDNWREDYIRKRAEYAMIENPEYWIIDPKKQQVWVMSNPAGQHGYEQREFKAEELIQSPQFPELNLTINQILAPAIVEEVMKAEKLHQEQALAEERQRTEREYQRAEQERQRAEQAEQQLALLQARLREQGIDI
ncbi:MAG: Uma2 family endonuclease [Coleofasciculaceae cyanobacterium SM2_1_6]|nr:Uma2 family endonuclease [Coleofasciculaceae cyanobacterium SM2_1_6]